MANELKRGAVVYVVSQSLAPLRPWISSFHVERATFKNKPKYGC
jgi:hypothetical protein